MHVPQRRRTALTAVILAALAALAAGCDGIEIEVPAGSLPAPVSIDPIPSASAGEPRYVCSAAYQILTDGAVRLAEHASGERVDGLRQTLSDMSAKMSAVSARADDASQRATVDRIAGSLATGSQEPDPRSFIDGDFTTIAQRLDGTCRSAAKP
ncbi:hypothetical protein [Actinoplanes utahensis]|uniref:Uncharacterized protein n=1 Tax=Actinoplanes utahensis TaxID=1869 RepID=A0A0A6UDX5_ACTUT|nr:hypothetical protein [Actinoplanes utahensis]KHD73686.1 hypothetical protein MB27_33565 [Actinoplanes utahensis]GIF34064.1 hypothetical protein Aut01nite_70500 [Actinoplanes utahensis]